MLRAVAATLKRILIGEPAQHSGDIGAGAHRTGSTSDRQERHTAATAHAEATAASGGEPH
jgi:hypothetical protein